MVTLLRIPLFILIIIMGIFGAPTLTAQVPVIPTSGSSSTSNGGMSASGSYVSSSGGIDVSWSVVKQGSEYNYVYSITNASGGSLSSAANYLLLQVSTSITSSNISTMLTNVTPSIIDGPTTFTSSETGNSQNLYGVVFGQSSGSGPISTISFSSTLAPVWGSLYVGNSNLSSTAYNTGYGTNPAAGTTNFSGWVATPGVAVPEPSTWLIMGSLLAFILLWKSRRARSKA